MIKNIVRTAYHWQTLLLWGILLVGYTLVPQKVSVGGCSGCFPNDAGELMCTNSCGAVIEFLPYAAVAYGVALGLILAYRKFCRVKENKIS